MSEQGVYEKAWAAFDASLVASGRNTSGEFKPDAPGDFMKAVMAAVDAVKGPTCKNREALIRLHPSERDALQRFCNRHGDITASVLLELPLDTVVQAVAGCPLTLTTRSRLLMMLVRACDVFRERSEDEVSR